MEGELYPGEFEQMERNGRMDAIADIPTITIPVEDYLKLLDAIPRERIEQMVKEIRICKTENEMRIAERDYKNKLLISGIFSEVMAIIHKYTKEQNNDK